MKIKGSNPPIPPTLPVIESGKEPATGKGKEGDERHNLDIAQRAKKGLKRNPNLKEPLIDEGKGDGSVTISSEARKAAKGEKVEPPAQHTYERPKPLGQKPKDP